MNGQAAEQPEELESRLEEAFQRLVEEGEQRLHRDWPDLLATATVAGLEVGTGVLAFLAVEHATGSPMLGGLAFSFGFLALLLGHSELFTEGFLVPVTAVAGGRASIRDLVRLWAGTLVANIAGGWIVAWLIARAFPELGDQAIKVSRVFAETPLGVRAVCLTVLAGSTLTLMTRMQHGTEEMVGKIAAAIGGAFLLAGLGLFHSILDSILMFVALHSGHAPFGYLEWLRFLGYAVVGNVIGGVGLVTLLRLVRTRDRLQHERRESAAEDQRPS